MKKVINQPADFVDETMEGIVAAYGDRVHFPVSYTHLTLPTT